MSYQVRRLEPSGYIACAFVSTNLAYVWSWLDKQRGRKIGGQGRRWIEERQRPALPRGRRGPYWPQHGLIAMAAKAERGGAVNQTPGFAGAK